jgi:hypothetical protein
MREGPEGEGVEGREGDGSILTVSPQYVNKSAFLGDHAQFS